MSTDFRKELRALVDDHHRSLLPVPDYRRLRSELLERVAREGFGEQPQAESPDMTTPRAPQEPADTRPRVPAPVPQPPAETAPKSAPADAPSKKPFGLAMIAVAVVVVAGIGTWLALRTTGPASPAPAPADATAPQALGTVAQMLADFVTREDWSSEELDWLDDEWRALEPDEHRVGKGSGQFRAFARELRERYGLNDAAGLETEDSRYQRDSLVAVAETMGIRLGFDAQQDTRNEDPGTPARPADAEPKTAPAQTPAEKSAEQLTKAAAAAKKPPAPAKQESPAKEGQVTTPADETTTNQSGRSTAAARKTSGGGCNFAMLSTRRKYCRDRFADGEPGPKLALIRIKTFNMGSDKSPSEQPIHEVRIASPFAVAVAETSFAEYAKFCTEVPEYPCPDNPWSDDSLPVVNVNWTDARAYAAWLGGKLGQPYRLLSEAEWEFATRAGSTLDYPFGEDILFSQAHFSDTRTHDRPLAASGAAIKANAFGLVHSVGNVQEWVLDDWQDDYTGVSADGSPHRVGGSARVVRGGSYADRASAVRSAVRSGLEQDERNTLTGIRVGRELPQ